MLTSHISPHYRENSLQIGVVLPVSTFRSPPVLEVGTTSRGPLTTFLQFARHPLKHAPSHTSAMCTSSAEHRILLGNVTDECSVTPLLK